MPNYTLCLLLRANLTEADCDKFLQDLKKILVNSQTPEVISWGKRDLAYPIAKENQAFYYLLNFEADGTIPATLDKKLKLAGEVLRFLIVRRAKKASKAESKLEKPEVKKEPIQAKVKPRKSQTKKKI